MIDHADPFGGEYPMFRQPSAEYRVNVAARSLLAQITADCALRGIRGVAKVGAPDTFDELCKAILADPDGPIPIAPDNSDASVFGRAGNIQFRAWHDREHFERGIGFGLANEACLEPFGSARLLGSDVRLLHRIEVFGQTRYYGRHGRFPVDQRAFTVHAFQYGIRCAVERGGF